MVRASDSEARVRVSLLTRVTMLCPLARQIYSPKVLEIPRKRWPRPNMSQNLVLTDLLAFAIDGIFRSTSAFYPKFNDGRR